MSIETVPDPTYVIDDSALALGCDLWFALPPGYTEVPLGSFLAAPQSPEGVRQAEVMASLLELAPQEQRPVLQEQLETAQALARVMPREGVIHFALGAHEGDDGALLESVLTLARKEIPFTPPKLAAAKAATSRSSVLPVSMVSLPCGPGAFVEGVIEYPATVDPQRRSVYEVTAYLPFPDGKALAVLTLTTTARDGHAYFRDIHRAVAETVSFDNPLPDEIRAQIPESEADASARAAFG